MTWAKSTHCYFTIALFQSSELLLKFCAGVPWKFSFCLYAAIQTPIQSKSILYEHTANMMMAYMAPLKRPRKQTKQNYTIIVPQNSPLDSKGDHVITLT